MATSTLGPMITTNILVLGETGVGKSTFINAFANYLNYQTIDEAEDCELISLIPTKFPVFDDDYKQQTVHCSVTTSDDNQIPIVNNNENENTIEGQSATQNCRSYLFPFQELNIQIIDTPGIGDTRGIEMDKKNFDNILSFISQFNELHAILILMKPNLSRLSVSFKYCLNQLLCQLSKSAGANIVFVFTNCRSTFYKPGQTLSLLEIELKKINDNTETPIIKLDKQTIYCLDNEGFRFLLATQNGIVFKKRVRRDFANSWIQASGECRRLMKYVVGSDQQPGLTPHRTYETITVNEVRRLVINLSKPLADIASNIQDNLRVLEEHEKDIINSSNNIEQLKAKLKIPVMDLKFNQLNHPATVCAHKDCAETFQLATTGVTQMHYKKRCHDHCYLTNVAKEILGDIELTKCLAMQPSGKSCSECGHEYKMHMHVYYESEIVLTHIESKDIKKQIKNKEDMKQAAENIVKQVNDRCRKFENEQEIITKATAKFAGFLSQNAIVPYNDSFKLYIEHLIENQKTLNEKGSKNKETIKGLTRMLFEYNEEVKIIQEAMKSNSEKINLTEYDINNTIQNLFNLEIYGEKIEDICNKQTKIRWAETNKDQSVYKSKGRIRRFYEWSKNILSFGYLADSKNKTDGYSKNATKKMKEKTFRKRREEQYENEYQRNYNKSWSKKKSKTKKMSEEIETLKTMMYAMFNMKLQEEMRKKKKKNQRKMASDSEDDDNLFVAGTSNESNSKKDKKKRNTDKLANESGFSGSESSLSNYKLSRSVEYGRSKLSDSDDSSDEFNRYFSQHFVMKKADQKNYKKHGHKKRHSKPKTPTPSESDDSQDSSTESTSDSENDEMMIKKAIQKSKR